MQQPPSPIPIKLDLHFYRSENTLSIARSLLGKVLVTTWNDQRTSGRIMETEAYLGTDDRASHAYSGKPSARTAIMFGEGGFAYVYACYGIHQLFNVVTGPAGLPHCVLIRALEPIEGIPEMMRRRNLGQSAYQLTAGPGMLTAAMGIHRSHSGLSLQGPEIWIEEPSNNETRPTILASSRVGIGYAGEDALLPYRFRIKNNPWTSAAK